MAILTCRVCGWTGNSGFRCPDECGWNTLVSDETGPLELEKMRVERDAAFKELARVGSDWQRAQKCLEVNVSDPLAKAQETRTGAALGSVYSAAVTVCDSMLEPIAPIRHVLVGREALEELKKALAEATVELSLEVDDV